MGTDISIVTDSTVFMQLVSGRLVHCPSCRFASLSLITFWRDIFLPTDCRTLIYLEGYIMTFLLSIKQSNTLCISEDGLIVMEDDKGDKLIVCTCVYLFSHR